ncbi:MAG TPA: hypothetical protein VK524_18405 [Polyangiaceae bacterium]|nr:hypothetical protein [Polyangiaceae bacterium]
MKKSTAVKTKAPEPRTPAQRQQLARARMRKAGFKLAHLWIHPGDYDALRAYVERKNARRSAD